MRPKKKKELSDWILRKLGAPIRKVQIDPTQIDDCIDQACDFFAEHAGGVGNVDSICLINPELVYYDGTGLQSQPGPTRGKWRNPLPAFFGTMTLDQINNLTPEQYEELKTKCGVISTPSPTGTQCCPTPFNSNSVSTPTPTSDCCPIESSVEGPGWCGKNAQPDHCFTDIKLTDPKITGPFWIEGDTTTKPSKQGFVFKTVYTLDDDIISVNSVLDQGMFGFGSIGEDGALFSPMGMILSSGGSFGMLNSGRVVDNRYGSFWPGSFSNGGFDIVGLQMSMQYLEMFRQMFTVKMMVQFNSLEHKLTISPAPSQAGVIAISCTRRVVDDALYTHQWVREYAKALTMINVGEMGRYNNMTFPGGASINYDMYLNRGDALREKLEKQIKEDNYYTEPPEFYVN